MITFNHEKAFRDLGSGFDLMKIGRPKKYKTEAERKAADAANQKKWRERNPEKTREYDKTPKRKAWRKAWLANNKYFKNYYLDKEKGEVRKKKKKEIQKKWQKKYKPMRNIYLKKRMANDIYFKLIRYMRVRISFALKRKDAKKEIKTKDLLGINLPEFCKYLEAKFKEGMNWENYGKWHVDHIKPIVKYDIKNPEELKKCFYYTNLQPLWAQENLKKSSKY